MNEDLNVDIGTVWATRTIDAVNGVAALAMHTHKDEREKHLAIVGMMIGLLGPLCRNAWIACTSEPEMDEAKCMAFTQKMNAAFEQVMNDEAGKAA